jgi:hypothetical protein
MGWGVFKGENGMGCFQGVKWDGVFSRGKMGWGVFKECYVILRSMVREYSL